MSDFPCLAYRCPGAHIGPGSSSYDYAGVRNPAELADRIAAGWSPTLLGALAAFSAPAASVAAPSDESSSSAPPGADDEAPPTRGELEAKALELGLKFDGRTPDRKLAKSISDAIQGG